MDNRRSNDKVSVCNSVAFLVLIAVFLVLALLSGLTEKMIGG